MKLPLCTFAVTTALCLGPYCTAAGSNPKIEPGGGLPTDSIAIPGPLRPFMRMAGLSPEVNPDDVLPEIARNVYMLGYKQGAETEYLLLLNRYVQLARDLSHLADAQGTIRVANCEEAIPLVHILGYEFENTCGEKQGYLVVVRAARAFVTVDSGFPLTALEDALRLHREFTYQFPMTHVPVLFHETDWLGASLWKKRGGTDLLDLLLHDQASDRLYWAMSQSDEETRAALGRSPGLRALLPLAPLMDFYGSQICIRSGKVLVPGGATAEREWGELVGASPNSPGDFTKNLLSKDHGWLAAYYDALSRVSRAQQTHLTDPSRFKRLYEVYRRAGGDSSAGLGVYAKNAGLLQLFTSVAWQPNGQPFLPATLAIWREVLTQKSTPQKVREWVKHANEWNQPDQLLLAIAACSVYDSNNGPLELYLTLSAIDGARVGGQPLSDKTVLLLADNFAQFHSWYLIFSEFPELDDGAVSQFVDTANAVNGISNAALRANAIGSFQANVGMWQIVARQQQIPADGINPSWGRVIQPFAKVSSSIELFEASRDSLRSLLLAAGRDGNISEDEVIDVLVGPTQQSPIGRRVHAELAAKMRAVLDDQMLVSLDTLFGLYDGMDEMAHGAAMGDHLVRLAADLREFELPRTIFTSSERLEWTAGIYESRHAELQVRTDMTKVISHPASNAQLEAARGQLTPFLRDTLVGFNYAYYEPPGAQTLHHNPLLVRSHDFSGTSIQNYLQVWAPPDLIGVGVTAGGGAYLIGSLSDLPYALALTEEDFIAPDKVQALIWEAEVPGLLVSAVQPRWWQVSPAELHAVALYQSFGEELLAESVKDATVRERVIDIIADAMGPKRLEETEQALLAGGDATALNSLVTPSEKFHLAAEFRREFPAEAASFGAASRDLDELTRKDPADTSPERLARDFGIPHPTLAHTNACDILNVKPFPAYSGEGYRLMSESWQSSNLYWARLVDEEGYFPAMLNLLVPDLTQQMIANIFSTDIEDWPALLRAMEDTGEAFRTAGKRVDLSRGAGNR